MSKIILDTEDFFQNDGYDDLMHIDHESYCCGEMFEKYETKISDLEAKLAEKEKEIESLRTRQFIDMTEKEMLELKIATQNEDLKKIKHIFNQDKISFAVAELEKVKVLIHNAVNIDSPEYDLVGLYDAVSNQIKQLKEGK